MVKITKNNKRIFLKIIIFFEFKIFTKINDFKKLYKTKFISIQKIYNFSIYFKEKIYYL
jgi:hypothetical protein